MPLKALFVIAVTTARMIFPMLPASPGQEAPKGPQSGPAVKSLTMRLYSTKTPTQPKASVTLPAGLKMGDSAQMNVFPIPEPETKTESANKTTYKNYWGSADTVPTGQPSVTQESATNPAAQDGYASIALWPYSEKTHDKTNVPESASTAGTYKLTTNYAGDASVTLGAEQNFLAPIALTDIGSSVDLEKPVKIEWAQVPNALAYCVVAYGGNTKETITWTAGTQATADLDVDNTAFSREEITKLVADKTFLPADAATATIPAGVFKDSSSVMLIVTAIGADKVQEEAGTKTHVIVRSTASKPIFPLRHNEEDKKQQ